MNLAAANAGGADANALARTFDECVHGLQIHVPAALRHVVGMTDAMPELRTTAANFTNFCHRDTPSARAHADARISIVANATSTVTGNRASGHSQT